MQPLLPPLSARMWRQSASVTGALQLGFADVLQWWEARFERITLEDRNLPEIAARRLLRPRNEAARQQIDRAYADTEKVRREVFETLLTPRADSAMFRKVYPFSPALVETLVAVSSLLQRERTALKVMLQILVDRRETLDLGVCAVERFWARSATICCGHELHATLHIGAKISGRADS